jgi:hypothetical protein
MVTRLIRRPNPNMSDEDKWIWIYRNWPQQLSNQFAVQQGTFTNNSPGAGSVAWASCIVEYNGQQYQITNGNTANKWIYWELATPTVFATAASFPTTTSDSIIVGANTTGTFRNAWKSGQGVNADAVVGTLVAAQIAADSITADKIDVATLSAISADMGTITAGTITGATIRTAASGARIELDSTNGIRGIDASANVLIQITTGGVVTIKTAATGNRVEITNTGLFGYDGSGEIFRISAGLVRSTAISSASYSLYKDPTTYVCIGPTVIGDEDSEFTGQIRFRSVHTPSAANDTGYVGCLRYDASYIYVCTATDTWKRVAISTW